MARRITQKYPTRIDIYSIEGIGEVKFANWENPLVQAKEISIKQVDFFRQFLSDNDLAIDIGANIGFMSLPISLAMGPKSMTLAFDPNPFVFNVLKENTLLNPEHTRIIPYHYAITETDDEFYYNSSEASFNNGGISRRRHSRHGKYELENKVKGIKLEKFLRQNYPDAIEKLKLIKINTEGYDVAIIKSIANLLSSHQPVIFTECYAHATEEERFEHYQILKTIGYQLYYISSYEIDAELIPLEKKEDMLKWNHFDFYGIFPQVNA